MKGRNDLLPVQITSAKGLRSFYRKGHLTPRQSALRFSGGSSRSGDDDFGVQRQVQAVASNQSALCKKAELS